MVPPQMAEDILFVLPGLATMTKATNMADLPSNKGALEKGSEDSTRPSPKRTILNLRRCLFAVQCIQCDTVGKYHL